MPEPFFALTEEAGKAWVNIILNVGTILTTILTLILVYLRETRSVRSRERIEGKVDRVDAQMHTVVAQSNGLLLQAKATAMNAAKELAAKTGSEVHKMLAQQAEQDYLNYKKIDDLKKSAPHSQPMPPS